MSLLGSLFERGKGKENKESFGKTANRLAVDIIKELSGSSIKTTKKVIDNLIVVTSASGGAGASTIVSNVAYMASKKDIRAVVVDLDILYPIQQVYFGVKPALEKPDLVSYLLGKNGLGESIETTNVASLMYANNRSLMDYINCKTDSAVLNFQEALDRLRQLFDIVIIDAPMRVDNILTNTAFYLADSIYLVWDEGIGSLSNTERIRRNMALSGIDSYTKMKIILNKRTNIHYSEYPFQKLNTEMVQVLPFDQDIIESSLRSVIFCHKGVSSSKNANIFYEGIEELTDKILRNGGYIG